MTEEFSLFLPLVQNICHDQKVLCPLGIQNTGEMYLAPQTQADNIYYRDVHFTHLFVGKAQPVRMQSICIDRQ